VLAKEAQDPAKPNIFSSSGILVTNFQSPFLSFYSNNFEFFPLTLGQELTRTGKFPGFSYGSFSYTVKKMEFRWRKSEKRNERDIERALGSRGTFLSRAGVILFLDFFFLFPFVAFLSPSCNCAQEQLQ